MKMEIWKLAVGSLGATAVDLNKVGKDKPFCVSGDIDAEALTEAFERQWDYSGLIPGDFEDLEDAKRKANAVAIRTLHELCPESTTKNWRKRLNRKALVEIYDSTYNWAFTRLTS